MRKPRLRGSSNNRPAGGNSPAKRNEAQKQLERLDLSSEARCSAAEDQSSAQTEGEDLAPQGHRGGQTNSAGDRTGLGKGAEQHQVQAG